MGDRGSSNKFIDLKSNNNINHHHHHPNVNIL